jgi:hypothetical protein
MGGQNCKSQRFELAETLDYMMGEFNGGSTAADGWKDDTRRG